MLLQAAFSHLELALVNVSEQTRHHQLSADQRSNLSFSITKLQKLALEREQKVVAIDDFTHSMDSATLDVQACDGEQLGLANQDFAKVATDLLEVHECLQSKSGNCEMRSREKALQDTEDAQPPAECGSTESRLEAVDMLNIMIEAFRELCHGDSFAVPWNKLPSLSITLGLRGSLVQSVLHREGKTHDGLVFEKEWSSLAKDMLALHKPKEIVDMIKAARRRRISGHLLSSTVSNSNYLKAHMQHRLTLSCKSRARILWDTCMLVLLIYVALALPLTFAFDNLQILQGVDQVVDWIFFCDMLVNFRTTFINDQRQEEWNPKVIAIHYLKSWFLLDFVSSFPLEQVSNGILPRLQSAKLLKFGKLAKVTKVFRLSKVAKMWSDSEIMELVEEFLWSNNLNLFSQGCMVMLQLATCGHWSACLLLACDGGAVDAYLGQAVHGFQKYLVALYWAIMTMTTVGYGDVTMQSHLERLYAIIAMMIGGTFYGYIIGVVTTILVHRDADQRVFRERMDAVANWLNHHYELSPTLRRRVWRHFKEYLTATRAVEDSLILNDLPPDLCKDVSDALLQDSVRHNPYFKNLSLRAISALVGTLIEVKFLANEVIVDEGDAGKAMFILDRGFVHLEKKGEIQHLCAGHSFGVEILLRDVKDYTYTVKTRSKVRLYKLLREDFVRIFKEMPKDLMTVLDNFYHAESVEEEQLAHLPMPGVASLVKGGPNGIAPDFSNVVPEHFNHLMENFEKNQ